LRRGAEDNQALPAFFATLPLFRLQDSFHADGNQLAADFQKRAKAFFDELLWFTEALAAQRKKTATAGA